MDLYKRLKYLYLKRCRYLEPMLQDIIAEQTNFKPYKITLYRALKQGKTREFNYFTFEYQGLTYKLFNGNLETISEDDI